MPDGPTGGSRWSVIALVATLAVLAVAGTVHVTTTLLSDAWSRGQIDLVDRFTREPPNPDWPYLDAADRTARVCVPPVTCVQAVGNEYLTVMKFATVDETRRHAETLGPDGRQIDQLVLHFNGTPLPPGTREEIVAGVSGINASSPE